MRCGEVKDNLVAYLDGELTPEERERVDSHLANCPGCRDEKAGLGSTGDLLGTLARTESGTDLASRVLREARSEEPWCRHIRREITAYLDGALGDAEARPVREHLEECDECRAEAKGLERTGRRLALWQVEPWKVDLLARVLPDYRPAGRRLRRIVPLAVAAILLVGAALGGAFGLFRSSDKEQTVAEPPSEMIANLDLLDAHTLDLLEADAELLEIAEDLEWLEDVTDEELGFLTGNGG